MTTKVEKLASIQAQAARTITGAFRATSKPALDIEAHLTPIRLQLEKAALHAYMRLAVSPLHSTLQNILNAHQTIHLRTWSQFERHQDHSRSRLGREMLDKLESKLPYTTAPWWTAPTVNIAETADLAKENHNAIPLEPDEAIHIYTDGSGINDKIGAAAVAPQESIIREAFMGKANTATVYAAELEGIKMALEIAAKTAHSKITIFTDNQAALKAIANPSRPSGQYILLEIIKYLDQLQENRREVELHWIPAHRGIEGNERADIAAKEATGWKRVRQRNGKWKEFDTNDTAAKPEGIRHLQAAAKHTIRKAIQREWEEQWKEDARGRDLYRITPTPTRTVLKLHQGLSKPLSSILTQLRTGRIGLRHYLFNRNVPDIEDDRCRCGQSSQTIAHVLLNCRHLTRLRKEMWVEEDKDGRRRQIASTNLRKILNTPTYATKAAKFIKATELLGQFRSQNTTEQAEQ